MSNNEKCKGGHSYCNGCDKKSEKWIMVKEEDYIEMLSRGNYTAQEKMYIMQKYFGKSFEPQEKKLEIITMLKNCGGEKLETFIDKVWKTIGISEVSNG